MRVCVAAVALGLALSGCASAGESESTRDPMWTARLPDGVGEPYRALATGDLVLVVAPGTISAFDRGSGDLRWQLPKSLTQQAMEQLTITDDAVVAIGRPTVVYDLGTGETRFDVPADDLITVAATRDALLVADCRRSCVLTARDLGDGHELWRLPLPADTNVAMPTRIRRSPASDLVEPMRAPERGLLAAGPLAHLFDKARALPWQTIDARTGAVVGTWQLGGAQAPEFPYLDNFYLGELLVRAEHFSSGPMWVYDLRAGVLLWGPSSDLSPLGFADSVMMSSNRDNRPTVVEVATGTARWTGAPDTRPVAANAEAAVVWDDGELIGVDIATGEARWNRSLRRGHAQPAAALVDNRLSFVETRQLVVLDVRTGARLWRSRPGATLLGAGADWVVVGRGQSSNGAQGEVSLYAGD
jgi:outer membrane protein assembly factor BamB